MPTQAGANLTAIASDEPDGNVYITGFGDGVVRLFDKRSHAAEQAIIHIWRKHHTWIQSVHIQRAGLKEIITGRWVHAPIGDACRLTNSMNGEVRIWDARRPDAPLYEEVVQPHGLMALAVHSGAPVMARSALPLFSPAFMS